RVFSCGGDWFRHVTFGPMKQREKSMPAELVILCLCTLGQPATRSSGTEPLISSRIERRVVKSFDFDESRLGNFELTPMNWSRHVGEGFPRYLQARFDRAVGHTAAPSLRL